MSNGINKYDFYVFQNSIKQIINASSRSYNSTDVLRLIFNFISLHTFSRILTQNFPFFVSHLYMCI